MPFFCMPPDAEMLFYQNVRHNTDLAKGRAKPKHCGIYRTEVGVKVNPDEVISGLKKNGINISRNTLLNYERWGLIPLPTRGSAGRGKGRTTYYPDETVAEAYASYNLMHNNNYRLTPEQCAAERKAVLNLIDRFYGEFLDDFPLYEFAEVKPEFLEENNLNLEGSEGISRFSDRQGRELTIGSFKRRSITYTVMDRFKYDWLMAKAKVEVGVGPDEVVDIVYNCSDDVGTRKPQVIPKTQRKEGKNYLDGIIKFAFVNTDYVYLTVRDLWRH